MKNIAFVELDTHAEVAGNFLELMRDSKQFKVEFYFSEKILKHLDILENDFIFQSSADKILKQISGKKYDLIIIGTAHRNFNIYLKLISENNVAIICHNLNFCTSSKLTLIKNIFKKDFVYRLKLLVKEGLLSAPIVFRKAKNLLVLDEDIAKNRFKFLPVFFNKYQEARKDAAFSIVIPGSVSKKRRDYKKVIKTISELEIKIIKDSNFSEKLIEFIFLGKAKGDELKKIINLERSLRHISIKYFTEKVSVEKFDSYMNKANLLWCPVQSETEFFNEAETYGKTKISGNIGDAIKYGKTAIFPETYLTSKPFVVKEKEVGEQILNSEKAEYNFQPNFNIEKIREQLELVLQKLL